MKCKKVFKETDHSGIYKKARRMYLYALEGLCDRCPPHKGCNVSNRYGQRNWKIFRKTNWK